MDLEELKELIKYQKKINIKRNLETKNLLLGEELIFELIERCEKAEAKLLEIEKQEPIGQVYSKGGRYGYGSLAKNLSPKMDASVVNVYALPLPQQQMQPLNVVDIIVSASNKFEDFKTRVTYKLDEDSGLIEFYVDGKETTTWVLDDISGAEEVFEDYLKSVRLGWIYAHTEIEKPAPQQSDNRIDSEYNQILKNALKNIIQMNLEYAHDRYGNANEAENMACVKIAREALAKLPPITK